MIANSLVTQIVTAVIALGIAFSYIKPTMGAISEMQDQISVYNRETANVEGFRKTLGELVSTMDNQPRTTIDALNRYLPEKIDSVEILRHIYLLTQRAGLSDVALNGTGAATTFAVENGPTPHAFSLSFSASYVQLKDFLLLLERNNFPLEVRGLKITPKEGGFLSISLDLVTYSANLADPVPEVVN